MELIFHEKQEGSLCAQHCLNALLQGQYFSPVDLAEIAERLDVREREFMAEGGVNTAEYRQFLQQPSSNFDDSGFFSVQVISEALTVWGLEMIPYNSRTPDASDARLNPNNQRAFICNFQQHWFAVRKFGNQWFNLNSLLTGPELISDTYLSLFLTQLQQEGYSIFIIQGRVPDCEADQLLRLEPAVQTVRPSLLVDPNNRGTYNKDIDRAIEESKKEEENEDLILQRALEMSMQGIHDNSDPSQPPSGESTQQKKQEVKEIATPSAEEVRKKRLAFFNLQQTTSSSASSSSSSSQDTSSSSSSRFSSQDTSSSSQSVERQSTPSSTPSEDELLQIALQMSMENVNT